MSIWGTAYQFLEKRKSPVRHQVRRGGKTYWRGEGNANQDKSKGVDSRFSLAGGRVDGRTVLDNVDNMDSISASFYEYEILDGIRSVPMRLFNLGESTFYAKTDMDKVQELAAEIKQTKTISPLIVAIGKDNLPWILEGGHRFDALKLLKAKAFPAIVVIDKD